MRVATRLAFQAGTVSAWAWSHSSGRRWCRSSASASNVEADAGEHPSATASGSGVNAATVGVPAPPRVSGAVSTDGREGPRDVSEEESSAGCANAHW